MQCSGRVGIPWLTILGCLIASEIVGVKSREIGRDTFKRFFRRCLGSRKVINCNTLSEKIQEKGFRKFWFSSQGYSLVLNFGIIAKQKGTAGISNSDFCSNGSRPWAFIPQRSTAIWTPSGSLGLPSDKTTWTAGDWGTTGRHS